MRRDDVKKLKGRGPKSAGYEVGYAKPPVRTRFRPGESGNPGGRPKGSKNRPTLPSRHEERLKSIILEEAYRTISINDARGPVKIPMAQAIIRSHAVNAAKGKARAQRLFAELLGSTEQENRRLHDQWLETAISYKADWERELERRKALGIEAPAPLPHPDDIIIDMRTGAVRITGPMTREEKVVWDGFRERKRECDRSITELEALIAEETNESYRAFMLDDIEHEKRIRAIISRAIPD